ncbi:MAG: hypothetical protein FWH03_02710 [Firmicutes bacterium]|nr:hypothetical protein [Bacillota bacterium]
MKTIKIEIPQIQECLLKLGENEIKAAERAAALHTELTQFVPNKFQSELDYYLLNLKPSETVVGIRLAALMRWHLNSFFDALSTLAEA